MENKEKNLLNLFKQLGKESEKLETPDLTIKNAVFSTIDSASVAADMLDLFTFKFLQAQSEVISSLPEPENEYDADKKKFFTAFNQMKK